MWRKISVRKRPATDAKIPELSEKGYELYRSLLVLPNKSAPASMIGDRMVAELGVLIQKKGDEFKANTKLVAPFYAKFVREKMEEGFPGGQNTIIQVMGELEKYSKEYGSIGEEITYGLLEALEEPVAYEKHTVRYKLFFDDKKPKMKLITETVLDCSEK